MKNIIFTIMTVLFLGSLTSNAQIAIAVAKNKKGSSLEWMVVWNQGWKTEGAAKKKLRAKGYDRVYTLTGGEKRGHNLTSGYWVVVEASHRIYDGTRKTSFGLGASKSSYGEAERRAVSNLSQYDWTWKKSHGYSVSKRGRF